MSTTTTTLRHLNNSFIGANRVSSNTLTNFFNGVMYYAELWDGATQIAEWNMQTGYGSSLYDTIGSFVNNIYGATWIIDDETGFNFHALTDDGTGKPRFGVYYNGRPLFVVDTTTGNSRFGSVDSKSRDISIGSDGILAKDGNGVVIHDLPDEPILTNNAYLGHVLWFQDSSTYKIYDVTNFPIATWTDVTCLTAGSTNVKAGIFKVYLNSDNNNSGVVEPFNFVWLRPKGSSWAASSDANTPEGRLYLEDRTAGIDSTASVYFLICPIGTDNKIQFNANAQPSGNYKRIVINQLGVLI